MYLPPLAKRLVPKPTDNSEPTKSISVIAPPSVCSRISINDSSLVELNAFEAPLLNAISSFSSSTSITIGLTLNADFAICNPIIPTPPTPKMIALLSDE